MTDNINNPKHYRQHAHECIEFTMHMNFNLGNAFKYIWRHKEKNGREDLEKAIWYLERQRDDAPKFKKLKGKKYCEMRDKLCLIDFDIDNHAALGAVLYVVADCTEDNISWALACVKDLLKKMPSGSPMPSENIPNPERK
jgi:identified by metaGeneAnnotator|nr:MAG TPA: nucelotide kinase [Caudoviricetes sp.]